MAKITPAARKSGRLWVAKRIHSQASACAGTGAKGLTKQAVTKANRAKKRMRLGTSGQMMKGHGKSM